MDNHELYNELFIAVELFKEAQEDTEQCPEIMLSSATDCHLKAAKLMNKMYEARDYMYSLVE